MFQELLEGASLIGAGERKPSLSNPFEPSPSLSPSPSPSPSPSSSSTAKATTAATPAGAASAPAPESQNNLHCPRCDSTNTKFCYYNNYNLTQPRHFCKTCRRYWTKGGALRNVPIGGGCRKNKSIVSVTATVNGKSSSGGGRFIKTVSSDQGGNGKPGFGVGGGFGQNIPVTPASWASSSQNPYLMALLRATQQSTNPDSNPSPLSNFFGSMGATEALSSFWRNNQNQAQQMHHNQQQQIGLVPGEVQNNGNIHEIYQRLRSTANYYPHDHLSSPLHFAASSSSSTAVLESAPVSASAAQLGYWNPSQATLTWSDLQPTSTGGAYP